MIKSFTISLSLLFLAIFALKGSWHESETTQRWNSSEALSEVISHYDKSAYESFYSLDDLRPYSIIQLKKTIEMYEQKWIEPEKIVGMLDQDEKEKLREKIVEYINDLDVPGRKATVNRIKHWSIADRQLDFFKNTLLFDDDQLIEVFNNIKDIQPIFGNLNVQNSGNIDSLSSIQMNKAFNLTKNALAEMDYPKQLRIYAVMYSHFSEKVE